MRRNPGMLPLRVIAAVVAGVVVLIATAAFHRGQARLLHERAAKELGAIARLKADQISLWILDQREDAALRLRIPLDREDMPPAAAARGRDGFLSVVDHRGVPVLSVVKTIQGSPSHIAAQVDESEALSEWRYRSLMILGLLVGAVLVVIVVALLAWQSVEKSHYRALFAAESASRQSHERYVRLVEHMAEGVIEADAQDRIHYVNPSFCRMVGRRREELLGTIGYEIFAPEEEWETIRDKTRSRFRRLSDTYETCMVRPDGRRLTVSIRGSPLHGPEGAVIGSVGLVTDITEQSRARETLRRRLAYEEALSRVSAAAAKGMSAEEALDESLPILGQALDISRAYIFVHREATNTMDTAHEWCAEGVAPQKEHLQGLPGERVPWWIETLRRGETIRYLDIEDIPDDATKEVLRPQEILSILVVPLFVAGRYWGFMGFDECRAPRGWPDEDVEILRAASRIMTGAIERAEVVAALRHSKALLDVAGRMARVGGWSVDLAENRVIWSDQVAAIHDMPPGYSPTVEQGIFFYAPEWRDRIARVFDACAREGTPYDEEMEIITAGGSRVWVRTIGEPLRDTTGAITHVHGAFQDITERRMGEKALEDSQRLFSTLATMAPIGIFRTDAEGATLYVNPRWSEISGLSSDDARGDGWLRAVHPDDREALSAGWRRAAAAGRESTAEYRFLRPAGGLAWVWGQAAPEFDAEGTVTGYVGAITDITGRKKTEEALRRLLEDKDTLLREVHHRVKNNLQAMIFLIGSRLEEVTDERTASFLRGLQEQARAMSLVYEQVYQSDDLSHVRMDDYLEVLCRQVLLAYAPQRDIQLDVTARELSLEVSIALPCGLIVNELITNSLKYAFPPSFRDHPRIAVGVVTEAGRIRLTVEDNGVGLPSPEEWSRKGCTGLRLVHLWATHQLGGTIVHDAGPGTRITVRFST